MGLFIRDDTVREMARRLAEARHTTVTEAVRQALEHDLAEIERDRAERDRAIRQIWAELDAMPDYDFDEDDMYDDIGAPK
ncbi:MAG: type II toxin-antitoxin system VapB family antitoxin [Geminicoccaceae bacterium]